VPSAVVFLPRISSSFLSAPASVVLVLLLVLLLVSVVLVLLLVRRTAGRSCSAPRREPVLLPPPAARHFASFTRRFVFLKTVDPTKDLFLLDDTRPAGGASFLLPPRPLASLSFFRSRALPRALLLSLPLSFAAGRLEHPAASPGSAVASSRCARRRAC